METILSGDDLRLQNHTLPSAPYRPPNFRYLVPKSSKYTVVLERTSIMNANGRWKNVRRAFYRFLNYVPVGAEVSIITFGKEAAMNLPPTVVTDANREGLHGRIPRKVLADDLACVFCALNMSLGALNGDPGTVILLTGSPRQAQNMDKLIETVSGTPVRVFPIAYPGTAHRSLVGLARHGKHYAVSEGNSASNPLNYLTEVLLDILRKSEPGAAIQKVHETRHLSYEFAGTFTLDDSMLDGMSVTLNVDDEDKVEFFEITNPSGKKHLFSKFEDGMVVFEHRGAAEAGIWTYHSKLYPTAGLPAERMTVDVVSHGGAPNGRNGFSSPIMLDVFSNVDGVEVDLYERPVIIYARLTQGDSLPVLGARVVVRVMRPGSNNGSDDTVELTMRDDGAGDPDVTGDDGIYSVHFSDFASVPGFYSVQVVAGHNDGLARTAGTAPGESEVCCGSRVRFRETIPASPFHRQAVGPGFYVKQGLSPRTDVAPPSRIFDFRLARAIEASLYVQLEWSSPGGDYDQGKGKSNFAFYIHKFSILEKVS